MISSNVNGHVFESGRLLKQRKAGGAESVGCASGTSERNTVENVSC